MQLVIDIPQTTYNHVFDNAGISNNDLKNILLGISKSVILPSGHGRLIDADALKNSSYRIDDSASLASRDVVNADDIDDAPTIIEADKVGEEKKCDS